MSRRGAPAPSGRKLLSLCERLPEFGDPIGCVASTFTFDAGFFEEECLARFAGIESDSREERHAYLVEREEKLSQLHASVLVDASHAPRSRSLRWNALPVAPPGGGILHAKVSLLAWRERIRLMIGSANLTEPGYRRNFEQVSVLDFGPDPGLPRTLLADGIRFLRAVAALAPGAQGEGPKSALDGFLGRVESLAERWPAGSWARGEPQVHFVPVQPGGPSLFERIGRENWSGTGPDFASVMSPFYDDGDGSKGVVDALVGIMGVQGTRTLEFYAPGRKHADGVVEIDLPTILRKPWAPRREHGFGYVPGRDQGGEARDLHAKSLWLERGDRVLLVIGSSNFTRAGTGVGRGPVNVEANLAFQIPEIRSAFGNACHEAYPPYEDVDLKAVEVRFIDPTAERTPDASTSQPLPPAFGFALYRAGDGGSRVELAIASDAPPVFEVTREDGGILLSRSDWFEAGKPALTTAAWSLPRPPSCLLVHWSTEAGEPRLSVWPVNVADPNELPPPDELRTLDLDELLEILTSARPLHEAVALALRKRAERQEQPRGPIVDPHKKVDTRNFLLRRVRRVSEALEGLRERLERPAYNLAGLRWRLDGPVGPVALARRLAEQEGQGAAFMIAEVVLTLRHADWSALEQDLGRESVRSEIARATGDLIRLAAAHPAPPNLARYVTECFAEVGR